MADLTMEMPKITLGIRIKVPVGYRIRMTLLLACFRIASVVAPPGVLVEVKTDGD